MDVNDNRLIMIGTVSSINATTASARVVFEDRDNMVSGELPILFTRAHGMRIYAMPKPGEQVTCVFLANGLEEGFIVGAYYDEEHPPPVTDESIKVIEFENGDYIKYQDGHMEINCEIVKIISNVEIEGNLKVTGTTEVAESIKSPTFIGNVEGLCKGAH